MEEVLKFLINSGTFYLATTDEDQPRVRPFGAICEHNGKLYIGTNNTKTVFKQLSKNPKIEISAARNGEWIRLVGEAVFDTNKETKLAMLEKNPGLTKMYSVYDNIMEVFYIKNAKANLLSFAGKNERYEF